jgi:hypothetical protein
MNKEAVEVGTQRKTALAVYEYLASDEYAERCLAEWDHYLKRQVILKQCPIIKLNKNEGK